MNAGDSTIIVRQLNADLEEQRKAQGKLLMKYVKDDPNVLPYFASMNRNS